MYVGRQGPREAFEMGQIGCTNEYRKQGFGRRDKSSLPALRDQVSHKVTVFGRTKQKFEEKRSYEAGDSWLRILFPPGTYNDVLSSRQTRLHGYCSVKTSIAERMFACHVGRRRSEVAHAVSWGVSSIHQFAIHARHALTGEAVVAVGHAIVWLWG